ncbi:bumetanide-sensitive sodium-(potassium)-chloride cotransporter [Anthonomus grandis grandis]|uniref:bumetanide-sensitive sodium-(potassium)-chloride cotransporter n=1 Tax=Anthonomus grandis grandis TaxID=2921223 RepID=UPI0021664C63|nr:bumetanide-sensitive sodium-(potassium)-chloride cotransporter [Anthonomus grandis grandis]XP_050303387.1 bumetanide-sensitive sodium-(potassium)-chloride cotransporter [Anthonomus grandis grandis]XP_050303388.1 bumetanide-sensitive sodium-(potassium)-chloride cotransporter [Anthonomus grandis grandis]
MDKMDTRFASKPHQYYENAGFQMQENGGGAQKNRPSAVDNDKRRRKSIVQITKEVLPRIENYRNSRRAVRRPSLGELHGSDEYNKEKNNENVDQKDQTVTSQDGIKLGWIQGVLIPCLLNIFGVMLFLRLSWIVSEAGTGLSLIIILISAVVCVITTLSLSAICTNGEVKGGGIYYIISRSLGPEFGASVGIVFAFANAVSASMNTIGFCNSLSALLRIYGYSMFGSDINDARVIGTVATLVMIAICAIGMEWESKAQNFLIAIIVAAMADFLVGTIMGPTTELQQAQGFTGFNATVWQQNWYPEYRKWNGQEYDFFQVFAIFFPSVTGIQAGANISGDLKDPASAIPKGTLLSLLITMTSYAVFMLFAGGAAIRDASGNITDLHSGNLTGCVNFENPEDGCKYGIFSSDQMMTIMSAWWPLIYAGCWAACLSTALTNLLSVPRLIQALGIDQIYPGLIFFSKGYGKHGEPYRGYLLTFLVAEAFLLIGELNDIAKLISNFYLASYALINFCTFHAALVKPLGWRPTFKYYNTWLSLFGFIACVVIMFLINWITSLITFIVILGLYLVVVYRNPDVNWGSSTQAQTYKTALLTAQKLINVGEHVKNYKPQVLVLCGRPKHRPSLMDFANLVTKNHSLLIVGDIIEESMNHKQRSQRVADGYAFLKSNKIKAFYAVVDNMEFETGATGLMQMSGIGKLTPNVLMMGYKNEWTGCSDEQLLAYFNILHAAFDHHLAVAILRVQGGLDYSSLTDIDDYNSENSMTPSNPRMSSLRTSPSSNLMMHSDSNLSLEVAVTEESGENATKETRMVNIDDATNEDTALSDKEKKKKAASVKLEVVLGMSNEELLHVEDMNIFRRKQGKGFIDVYWLYDDGGLTMLLPYIISTRKDWSSCKLRVYGLASNKNDLALEERNMAHLLTKFRLNYAALKMISVNDKPKQETIDLFNNIVEEFRKKEHTNECQITDAELSNFQEKTHRQLRLRELMLENSNDANLIVMSLPMPRKGSISAPLYMSWLEVLSKDMPPFLLIRGNQQSVLTYYS